MKLFVITMADCAVNNCVLLSTLLLFADGYEDVLRLKVGVFVLISPLFECSKKCTFTIFYL